MIEAWFRESEMMASAEDGDFSFFDQYGYQGA